VTQYWSIMNDLFVHEIFACVSQVIKIKNKGALGLNKTFYLLFTYLAKAVHIGLIL
jgi:hypothetical protein